MIIEKLTLRNFRNYEDIVLTPHEGVNLFFGENGSGKTNLLEAIHYCALEKAIGSPVIRVLSALVRLFLYVMSKY